MSLSRFSRLPAGLLAGAIATAVNMLVLKAAGLVHLETAKGGLLKLAVQCLLWISERLEPAKMASIGAASSKNLKDSQSLFHILVGLSMAVGYVYIIERILPGRALVKGLIYAALVWILNAAIVLPVTGEGFAGSAHLTLLGMVWFGAGHTLYFMILARTYELLTRDHGILDFTTAGHTRPDMSFTSWTCFRRRWAGKCAPGRASMPQSGNTPQRPDQ